MVLGFPGIGGGGQTRWSAACTPLIDEVNGLNSHPQPDVRLTNSGLQLLVLGFEFQLAGRPATGAEREAVPTSLQEHLLPVVHRLLGHPARRPAVATDNSPRSTLNTTHSFSSGLFFEAFAMLISLRQTQTAD